MTDTHTARIDQDIQPTARLEARVADAMDTEVGIPNDEAAVVDALDGVDVVFATSRVTLSRTVLEATDLSVVAKLGTGIDNVDLEAAREQGVAVTHTPGVNALSVAEHTLGLLLAVSHNIQVGDRALEAGGWRDQLPMGVLLSGSTVGIVGFGNIGQRVAGLLSGFDVEVLAHDPYIADIDTQLTGAERVGLDELFERADHVTVNAELTPETRGMVGDEQLDRLEGILVNTARGPIVDEAALLRALREGSLAGAGLDVFETEPLPSDSPLHEFDNVVATPHSAAMTGASREATIDQIADNALALVRGEDIDARWLAVKV
ncbi:MAG: NAD(P)-dependent oxidoreductase [Haloarculaceae archaeon]